GKVELLAEGPVLVGRVEADAKDRDAEGVVLLGLITQALALDRSAGRVGLGIPPQQHPAAAQIGEVYRVAVVVERREIGSRSRFGKHAGNTTLHSTRAWRNWQTRRV